MFAVKKKSVKIHVISNCEKIIQVYQVEAQPDTLLSTSSQQSIIIFLYILNCLGFTVHPAQGICAG